MRSKKCIIITTAVFLTSFLQLTPVFAASCGAENNTNIIDCGSDGAGAVWEIISTVIDVMTFAVGILGVIGITVFGIQYLTSRGNDQRLTKAKRRLLELIIGLAVYAILRVGASWLLPGRMAGDSVTVTKITAGQDIIIEVGDSIKAGFTVYPLDASNNSLKYSSSKKSVATIDENGVITAKNAGSATIKATSVSDKKKSATMTVTVTEKSDSGGGGGGGTPVSPSGSCNFNSVSGEGCIFYCQGGGEPWAGKKYGNRSSCNTYAFSACGPTSLAMVIANLTGDSSVTPTVMGDIAIKTGARNKECTGGTNGNVLIQSVKDYGLHYEAISFTESSINKALSEGKVIYLSGKGRSPFSDNGHYIAIRGKTADGKWLLFNSAGGCKKGHWNSSKKAYDPSYIINARRSGSGKGPWAIWK